MNILSCTWIHEIVDFMGDKGLKIVHLNAGSMLRKISDIEYYHGPFDVIAIMEPWLNESVHNSIIAGRFDWG